MKLDLARCSRSRTAAVHAPYSQPHASPGFTISVVAARLHLCLMRAAVKYDVVMAERALVHVADVVHEQNLLTGDLEAVRRLVQLGADALRARQRSTLPGHRRCGRRRRAAGCSRHSNGVSENGEQ